MYRGNNSYPDNPNDNLNNMPSISPYFDPHPAFRNVKIDMPISNNNSLPYYDQNTSLVPQNQYEYVPANMVAPQDNFIPRYSNWRGETPQSRGPSMHMHSYYQRPISLNQSYMPLQKPTMMNYDNYQPQPQMNIIQKISFLIKPQLSQLQKIMSKVTQKRHQSRRRSPPPRQRQRQRQRSRQKDRPKKNTQWMCSRCSFLNFDWRDRCKKCDQAKPSRNYSSGGEDWKCKKCDNLNFARRTECYRCKSARYR